MTRILELIDACEGMVRLLSETGLSDEQVAYGEVIQEQLLEMRALCSSALSTGTKPEQGASAPPRRARILVVDRDETQRLFLSRVLEREGLAVELARTGEEALERTQRERFDAMLIDTELPQLDGFAVTERIRRKETASGERLTIIAYTSHAMAGYQQRCLQSGMDYYLRKPLPSRELVEQVSRMVPGLAEK